MKGNAWSCRRRGPVQPDSAARGPVGLGWEGGDGFQVTKGKRNDGEGVLVCW